MNGNKIMFKMTKEQFDGIERHITITNEEMGTVKVDVGCLKTEVNNIKQNMEDFKSTNSKEHDTINGKLWWILTSVIVLSLISIAINVAFK